MGKIATWYGTKAPIFKFTARFGVLMILFYGLSLTYFFNHNILSTYLNMDARISGLVLNMLNQHSAVSGNKIRGGEFSMAVNRGCDGIEPTWMFGAAVLSFPVSFRRKLPGVFLGTLLLLGLNLVRIVSLFFAGAHSPKLFATLHLQVWPILFIFTAIIGWILWLRWAIGWGDPASDASA